VQGSERRGIEGYSSGVRVPDTLVAMPRKSTRIEHEVSGVVHGSRDRRTRSATDARAARVANDQLYDLTHGQYFQGIPLGEIFAIVERAGFHLDPQEKECILTGRDGKATWDLYGGPGQPLNHMLVLTWHKMETTGRYEVVVYVS
jgi:hypothetical protein